jgi:HEAT repeat protein
MLSDENSAVREGAAGALMNVSFNPENKVLIREAVGISAALKNLVSDANYTIRDHATSVLELLDAK